MASTTNPQVADKRSEEPEPKRQKLEEEVEEAASSSSDSDWDSDEVRIFNEAHKRCGDYDFDTTKLGPLVGRYDVVFEESYIAKEPETDGDLVERLSKIALKKYNEDNGFSTGNGFEFVRAVKANWHYASGNTFYISLEAKDKNASSPVEPIPFQASVGYHPWDGTSVVYNVKPKP